MMTTTAIMIMIMMMMTMMICYDEYDYDYGYNYDKSIDTLDYHGSRHICHRYNGILTQLGQVTQICVRESGHHSIE